MEDSFDGYYFPDRKSKSTTGISDSSEDINNSIRMPINTNQKISMQQAQAFNKLGSSLEDDVKIPLYSYNLEAFEGSEQEKQIVIEQSGVEKLKMNKISIEEKSNY